MLMGVNGKTNAGIARCLDLFIKIVFISPYWVIQKLDPTDFSKLIRFVILLGMISSNQCFLHQ